MRAVVDARMAGDGGIGTYLRNLLPRVIAARPHWAFTVLGHVRRLDALGWRAFPNVRLHHTASGYYSLAEQVEIPLRWRRGADLYWAPHYNVPLLMPAERMVVTVHDVCHLALPDTSGGALKRRYARLMFGRVAKAGGILFDSAFSRAEMARYAAPRGRAAVAPLGVASEWFQTPGGERPMAGPYLVYVGNWKNHKNVPALLRAFGAVTRQIPHHLVLVGRREGLNADPAIEPALRPLGDRVVLAGEVGPAELRRWVAHADALVTASLYEGFGLPPLEAMAAGRPCLVSRAGSLPEVCGNAALYCDPRSDSDIAAKLGQIATDQPLRRALVEAGHARAREFTWERTARITLDLLDQVVA